MLLREKRFMIIGNKSLRGLDVTALCHVHENKINFLKYLANFIFYGYFKIRIGNHIYVVDIESN